MFAVSAPLRAIVLTPINYVFLLFVFAPGFSPSASFLSFYLGGLAIYNVAQTILAMAISYIAIKALYRAAPNLEARTWFARLKSEPEAPAMKTN